MNEIKKAIADLQQHMEILDVRIKCHPESCDIDFLSKASSYNLAIQALQEKQERDKMRCENCVWLEKESFFSDDEVPMSEQTCYTCTFYGNDVPTGIPVENTGFCSHFEPKESEQTT